MDRLPQAPFEVRLAATLFLLLLGVADLFGALVQCWLPAIERKVPMRKLALSTVSLAAALLTAALPVAAHVSPNVELVKKGEFIQHSLPGVSRFEETLALSPADRAALRQATGWVPGDADAKVYVGRDAEGRRVGTVVLVWMPSQHGPVGIAAAFGPDGTIRRAAVTDAGSEPLAWIRPLVAGDGLAPFEGLALDAKPDPAKVAPQVAGRMNRYYAEVIAHAVARAQALARLSIAAGKRRNPKG